jgi:Zinc dependent phospholipase C
MNRRSILKFSLFSSAALFAVAVTLWPNDAYAWGPLAHLNFSQCAASDLGMLSPALRIVLSNFVSEFLYGSLAADIIVGKNLARYEVHCHNWNVGFSVLDRARTDAQKAFSFGFLSHLAVDTIAHNYYVPYKTVQGYRVRASGHAYWELRYDQRLPADLWKLARHVSQKQFREHDEHLEECLSESYVIPFGLSKTLFGSLLLTARLKKWQRMSEVIAGEKNLLLHDEEIGECRNLAVGHIVDMLRHGPSAKCVQVDPTGERNLHLASGLRSRLKKRDDLSEKHRDELARKSRHAFRNAIYGRLTLPELPDGEALVA